VFCGLYLKGIFIFLLKGGVDFLSQGVVKIVFREKPVKFKWKDESAGETK